jgi:hypothetical protein
MADDHGTAGDLEPRRGGEQESDQHVTLPA